VKGLPLRFIYGHNRVPRAIVTEETRARIRAKALGRKASLATRAKMSAAHRGSRSSSWKGDAAGYGAIHSWLATYFTKTGTCEECGRSRPEIRRTEWANISGAYLRDRADYRELCTSCHKRFDARVL
jgi:hypothetical protein